MLGGVTAAEAKSSKSAKYDLVIVGAGCGGLVCAIHAAELGLKPLLLEKMPMPAGNAIYAAGFLLGLNTSFQKAKNVPADTAEAFYDDMMKDSVILLEQLRTVDKTRLKEKVCHLSHEYLEQVDRALMVSLELDT